jgi:hypothetical protein
MKYQLPTSHWIYFCAQIKKGKIDASGTGGKGGRRKKVRRLLFRPTGAGLFSHFTHGLRGCGKSRPGREKRTSGAEAPTHCQ